EELIQMVKKPEVGQKNIEFDKKCILVVGVNGVGKTTSIAKLAGMYKRYGKKIILVAGDTFRAGAVEQLQIWAERLKVPCVIGKEGADPSSVMFEGSKEFIENNYDIIICDTAGRLHNKKNLMDELDKMKRTIEKNIPAKNIEVYMVLDSTTGQNGVAQVKSFYEKTSIDGIILTKLDSTSKGGVVFSILNELQIPIKYIGTGEKIEDIKKFNAEEFVDGII
ncbi:MAG: signal recognition particle-docking protein FtsY, partial [Clostridia bacterium]|nr:signal recognition particle-docking protein FtsY [Clostridia bacterium]